MHLSYLNLKIKTSRYNNHNLKILKDRILASNPSPKVNKVSKINIMISIILF